MFKKMAAIAALAIAPLACSDFAIAASVGDVVGVRMGCISQEVVERQLDAFAKHGLDGALAQTRSDIDNGDCLVAPVVVPVAIDEVGTPRRDMDWDGGKATFTPFRFDKFWSVAVEPDEQA